MQCVTNEIECAYRKQLHSHTCALYFLGLKMEVQFIALWNTLLHTMCSVAHTLANEPGHPGTSSVILHTAHSVHTAYCKASMSTMPFRTYLMFSLTAAQRCRSADRGKTDGWRGEGAMEGKRRGAGSV